MVSLSLPFLQVGDLPIPYLLSNCKALHDNIILTLQDKTLLLTRRYAARVSEVQGNITYPRHRVELSHFASTRSYLM